MSNVKDERELLSKPGDTILETLEHLRMSQAELSKRMGKTPPKINDIISGKEPITVNTALQLEKVLGIEAQFWLNRESSYREKLLRIEQEEALEACLDWLKEQPIKDLKKYGYLSDEKIGRSMVSDCLQFYGVDSPVQWKQIYVDEYAGTAFRKSNSYSLALASLAAWFRIGELEMRKLQLAEYDKEKFKEVLKEILQLVKSHPDDFPIKLEKICASAGVAIVFTPCLPQAPISGASRWVGGRPLIQLTDRYKTNDQFWFSFFHEAGHVLLHGKKEVFIEGLKDADQDVTKEEEANRFSADWLLPASFIKEFNEGPITEREVRRVARLYETHPAIVLGRLYKLDKVHPGFGRNMKLTVNLDHVIFKKKE